MQIAYLAVLGEVPVQDGVRRGPDLHFGSILEPVGTHLGAVAPLGRHVETLLDAPARTLFCRCGFKGFWGARGEAKWTSAARALHPLGVW